MRKNQKYITGKNCARDGKTGTEYFNSSRKIYFKCDIQKESQAAKDGG